MHPDEKAAAIASLESIGWRAASDEPADDLAADLATIFSAHGNRTSAAMRRDVAEFLRQHAHPMDGSLPPVTDWEPAADAVVVHYLSSRTDHE